MFSIVYFNAYEDGLTSEERNALLSNNTYDYNFVSKDEIFYNQLDSTKRIYSASVSKKENEADTFTVEIDENHFFYKKLLYTPKALLHYFKVFKNGDVNNDDECIFYGRLVSYEKSWNNRIKLTCEGCLAFLKDNFSFVTNREIDNSTVFRNSLLNKVGLFPRYHRAISTVDGHETFSGGYDGLNFNKKPRKVCNFYVNDTKIDSSNISNFFNKEAQYSDFDMVSTDEYKSFSNYELMQKCASALGVKVYAKLDRSESALPDYVKGIETVNNTTKVDQSDGLVGIHYLTEYRTTNKKIEFGKNLIDFTESISEYETFSGIYPSAFDSFSNDTLNVTSYCNPNLFTGYGLIVATKDMADAVNSYKDQPQILQQIFSSEIAKQIPTKSINITFLDLSRLGFDVEEIHMYDNVQVISKPHNLNVTLPVTEITYDLIDVKNSMVQLGKTYSTPITDQIKK